MIRRGVQITQKRMIKKMFGQSGSGIASNTTINQRAEIGRTGFTRKYEDHYNAQKKSHTLAYPEDALITEYGAAKVSTTKTMLKIPKIASNI